MCTCVILYKRQIMIDTSLPPCQIWPLPWAARNVARVLLGPTLSGEITRKQRNHITAAAPTLGCFSNRYRSRDHNGSTWKTLIWGFVVYWMWSQPRKMLCYLSLQLHKWSLLFTPLTLFHSRNKNNFMGKVTGKTRKLIFTFSSCNAIPVAKDCYYNNKLCYLHYQRANVTNFRRSYSENNYEAKFKSTCTVAD